MIPFLKKNTTVDVYMFVNAHSRCLEESKRDHGQWFPLGSGFGMGGVGTTFTLCFIHFRVVCTGLI